MTNNGVGLHPPGIVEGEGGDTAERERLALEEQATGSDGVLGRFGRGSPFPEGRRQVTVGVGVWRRRGADDWRATPWRTERGGVRGRERETDRQTDRLKDRRTGRQRHKSSEARWS